MVYKAEGGPEVIGRLFYDLNRTISHIHYKDKFIVYLSIFPANVMPYYTDKAVTT